MWHFGATPSGASANFSLSLGRDLLREVGLGGRPSASLALAFGVEDIEASVFLT